MKMKFGLNSPANPPGLLRKLVALIVTVALVGVVLMFSAVLLAIIMIVGTIAWTFLWWKSRELRKQMREFSSRTVEREQSTGDDGVFEGEVIRVVDSRSGR